VQRAAPALPRIASHPPLRQVTDPGVLPPNPRDSNPIRIDLRWPARANYREIVDEVATLVRTPPLDNPCLVVDPTAGLDRLLDGAKIQLVNTDPPYGVKLEPRSNNAIAAGAKSLHGNGHHQGLDLARHPAKAKPTTKKLRPKDRPLENDFVTEAEYKRLLQGWFANLARVLEPGRAFFIWGGYSNCANYPSALESAGLYFSQAIIWIKEHPVLTHKDFLGNHEWCFYGWCQGAAHKFFGPNNAVDVWIVKKVTPQSMVHLTEKPVALATMAMQYSSLPGENVLDLFGGSGSTLIAAEQNDRRAFLMEVDPLYCDTIVKRWEEFTGQKAKRADG
jgi:DNA modification methylase